MIVSPSQNCLTKGNTRGSSGARALPSPAPLVVKISAGKPIILIMRATSILFVAACVALAQNAHKSASTKPASAKPVVVESVVQGADISKIIAGLKALKGGAAPARGEFETAEAFEARIQAVPENL